jgi:hypothetical protein
MHRSTTLVALALSLGCGDSRSIVDEHYAVGWEGDLRGPLLMSGCGTPPVDTPVMVATGTRPGWFAARAVGDLEIRCGARDLWRIHVREPARYEVRAPLSIAVGERHSIWLEALDSGGERLSLGAYADVTWQIDGAIREAASLPHDFIGPSLQRLGSFPSISVEATGLGPGTIVATDLRGHAIDARATVTVTDAPTPRR